MTELINAALLKNMIISAANTLNENKGYVDSLNVFPVPDGDTGTNMALTFMSAAREVAQQDFETASDVAKLVAKATLRGARGNSGVILSQIFRGISKSLSGKSDVSVADFTEALQRGSDTAYRAVMKPTEGTILTVVRLMAKGASDAEFESFEAFFAEVNAQGKDALDKTPDLLPQLKQAGVVDAGGRGLLFIFEGFEKALNGETFSLSEPSGTVNSQATLDQASSPEEITFTYCTEFIIEKYNETMSSDNMRMKISPIGDAMEITEEGSLVKVHIHTNNPGYVLQQAVKLGELTDIKIENMKHKHNSLISPAAPKRPLAIISVAAGDGIEEVMKELGAAYIISGGQTMNPGTEDILAAIEKTNAESAIILPNNKNIILAAEQARDLAEIPVKVIPTKTIPQGITAMMNFLPEGTLDDNAAAMTEALDTIKSGSITHAVRDSSFEDMEIHEGDYLGMIENKISLIGQNLETTLLNLIASMTDSSSEIITVYYGSDADAAAAEALSQTLEEAYPDCDICIRSGGQPVYYYIVSVE
ncbi:MAG: DAK2 domain-containing protein [Clostridia bacterium]|nr:DAK2 domain-containing protein [Clostridia bacterium]